MSYNFNSIPSVAPPGSITPYIGVTDPSGWAICDGVSRSNESGQYNSLINAGLINQNSYSTSVGVQVDTLSASLGAGLSFIAISGDGTTLLLNGKYLTTNTCKSYSLLYAPYNIIPSGFNPTSCAISYTGNVIVMNGYQSITKGTTWNTNICSAFCALNGTGSTILIDSGTRTYIMLSTNYGQSYTQISGLSTGPYASNGLPTTTATVYGVCMSSSATIMAAVIGASYTLYFSTNGGSNWSNNGNVNAPTYLYMSASGNVIAYKNGGNLYISVNNGSTWNSYGAGGSSSCTYSISGDGTKIIGGYYYYTYAGSGNWTQYSLTQTMSIGDYLFWSPPTSIAAKQDFSAIYASSPHSGGNLLVSYNFCKQWYSAGGFSQTKFLQSSEFSNNSISTSYNGQIVLACQTYRISNTSIRSVIAKSTDSGNNWTRINFNSSTVPYIDNCGMSGDGNVMLWSWSFSGGILFMSTDGGNTITNLGGGGAGCIKLNYSGTVIYTISRTSTNMGATWSTSGIPQFKNMAMSYSGSTIIASSAAAFYLSINYGLNYTQISGTSSINASNGLPTTNYNTTLSVAISDDGNTMLAGIRENNIYLSIDAGTSWTTLSGPSGSIGSLPTTTQTWWSVAMSGDATKMLASAQTNIYFSQNSGVTWTNVVTSAQPYSGLISSFNCYVLNISGDGSKFIALGANGVNYGINISNNGTFWYNPSASGNSGAGLPANSILGTSSTTWQTYSSSGNGIYTLAGNSSSYLYLSNDGGYGFMALSANGNLTGTKNWKGSAISTTGQYMLAVAYNESVYYSNTYGSYWYQISGLASNPYFITSGLPTSNSNWNICSMDGTGTFMLAGINSGSLYLSTSSATYWTTIGGAANSYGLPTTASAWSTCTISTNATYMLAGINSGSLYMSTNTGSNWTMIGGSGAVSTFGLPTVSCAWSTVSINSTGSYMLAGINSGSLYMSTNSGTNWSTLSGVSNTLGLPTSAGAWSCSAINNTGTILSAAINGGSLYVSINSGKFWSTSKPFLASSGKWQTMAMNSSGNYITAAENSGYIYNINTGIIPTLTYTPPQISGTSSTDGTGLKYIIKL